MKRALACLGLTVVTVGLTGCGGHSDTAAGCGGDHDGGDGHGLLFTGVDVLIGTDVRRA